MTRHPGWRLVWALGLVTALGMGCSQRLPAADVVGAGDPSQSFPQGQEERPFLLIYRTPGLGGAPARGVEAAVWADGRVVRLADESQNVRYVQGRLTSAQLDEVRQKLGDSGILNSPDARWLVVDAAVEMLTVRWGERVCSWHHNPGFEGTGNANATDERITGLRKDIMALDLQDATPPGPAPWSGDPTLWMQ